MSLLKPLDLLEKIPIFTWIGDYPTGKRVAIWLALFFVTIYGSIYMANLGLGVYDNYLTIKEKHNLQIQIGQFK